MIGKEGSRNMFRSGPECILDFRIRYYTGDRRTLALAQDNLDMASIESYQQLSSMG